MASINDQTTNGHSASSSSNNVKNGNNEMMANANGNNTTNSGDSLTTAAGTPMGVIPKNALVKLDRTNQDIVRLIEQYLLSVGLE